MTLMMKFGICLLVMFNVSLNAAIAQTNPNEDSGQSKWKLWGGAGIDLTLSRKSEISVNYLQAYNLESPVKSSFNQASGSFDYDVTKKFTVKTGMTVTQLSGSGDKTYRYFFRGTYKTRLSDKINWSNGIQVEKHSANENRFDYRVIYITRLSLRKRLGFMNLSPSLSYWLYYNVGGSKIQYYDAFGQPGLKQTADGFHRGRLILNLNSKVSELLSFSLYYINQNEFNLVKTRAINVIRPDTGKITRPFNQYNVMGVSLLLNFNL